MEQIKEYIIGIVAVSMLIATILSLCGGIQSVTPTIKLLCGIVLSLAVLSPLINFKKIDFSSFYSDIIFDAQKYTMAGIDNYTDELDTVIKQKTAAYILDEAAKYECNLDVSVSLKEGVPSSVSISGNISPYAKLQMEEMIETELGIPKENQLWKKP